MRPTLQAHVILTWTSHYRGSFLFQQHPQASLDIVETYGLVDCSFRFYNFLLLKKAVTFGPMGVKSFLENLII